MAGAFRPSRGGKGYSLDWNGFEVLGAAAEAARRGINEVSEMGADMARSEHPWENRTGQTEASVFVRKAELELVGTTAASTPHVWGEWGVEDRPRYQFRENDEGDLIPVTDELGDLVEENVTTKDVALFLEFGTVKMLARPWLYPAWDATKVMLPIVIARYYKAIAASGTPNAIRDSSGRFRSWATSRGL